jgi:hypothetical protein
VFGSVVRAALLLLPAAITLFLTSWFWKKGKQVELSQGRVRIFRFSVASAWMATVLFLVGSIDQLKTRQILPGFWSGLNLCAVFLAISALLGALAGKGWCRVLLLTWTVLLTLGLSMVVASTIP